ncbi:diphthine--ammonia ligase [Gottfriedia solisilvae]
MAERIAISWSGGKDCCLALHRLIESNQEVACLFSMVSKKDGRNHAHGTPLPFLQMQADALGIPLIMIDSAGDYEQSIINGLREMKEELEITAVAFGTLYVDEDKKWNEEITIKSGLKPLFPVWIHKNESIILLDEWINSNYKAIICRARDSHFDANIVGQTVTEELKELLIPKEICVMGEGGEYHTFVVDGPLFTKRLNITESETILNTDLWSLNIKEMKMVEK